MPIHLNDLWLHMVLTIHQRLYLLCIRFHLDFESLNKYIFYLRLRFLNIIKLIYIYEFIMSFKNSRSRPFSTAHTSGNKKLLIISSRKINCIFPTLEIIVEVIIVKISHLMSHNFFSLRLSFAHRPNHSSSASFSMAGENSRKASS